MSIRQPFLLTTFRSILCRIGVVSLLMASVTEAGSESFENWPEGGSPSEVGPRIANLWLEKPFRFETSRRKTLSYSEVCSWYGSLEIARLTDDVELENALVRRFDRFTGVDSAAIGQQRHVDYSIFGALPLELYLVTGEKPYLSMGLFYADRQWGNPTEDGLSPECRFWIDDLYMLPILQVQAYRATLDSVYLDRAALTMSAYLDVLQKDNGLFFHAPDSPFFWGRGNGWVAAGVAELLRDLPEDNPHYERIAKGYRHMMSALLELQTASGSWRQLLDQEDSWEESSCTGMFTFAMVTGVKLGILDSELYAPAARKGWLALVAGIDENNEIHDVCIGTNKASEEVGDDLTVQRDYYLARPRAVGDFHGQAPVLWAAAALLR